jgi:hypothetical protein
MKAGVCLVAFCDLAPFIAAVSAEMADSGAVAERYRHAFGGLSVRFFVGQSVRNPADSAEFLAHSAGTEARTPNLHTVRRKVQWIERATLLPPELFNRFVNDAFWTVSGLNTHNVPVILHRD